MWERGLRQAQLLVTVYEKSRKWVLEELAVVHFVVSWLVLPLVAIWLPFYLLFTCLWWIVPLYSIWHFYNWKLPARGSRPWKWYKEHNIWKHFADYFPLRLVKTANLPSDRNYIIGCHPHGVLSIGAFTHFVTSGSGWSQLFPGLKSTILTLNGQFYFPLRRDVGLALGGCESSRESLEYLIESHPQGGAAIGIVLGGASESLDSRPGSMDLLLSTRTGFIRYALKYGSRRWSNVPLTRRNNELLSIVGQRAAFPEVYQPDFSVDLVPMFTFGETELYDQCRNPRGSPLRMGQDWLKRSVGFCPPFLQGMSLLGLPFHGLMPRRKQVTSVMGSPIRLVQLQLDKWDDYHRVR